LLGEINFFDASGNRKLSISPSPYPLPSREGKRCTVSSSLVGEDKGEG
jgi:hypothetical protein